MDSCSIDILICGCGSQYNKNERFHIYDHNFCSLECLQNYKTEQDKKKSCDKIKQVRFIDSAHNCDHAF
jgi:hypothetical protein